MRLVSVLLFSLILFSCGQDGTPAVAEGATLTGRWDLVEARRDNVKTNLLEGLYFVFDADGTFETNLLTNEAQSGTYVRQDGEITTEGVEVPMTYEIESLEEGELYLRSRYEGFLFDFRMQRGGTEAGETPTD
ncbi:hypothetical protein GGR28_001111 [Lewinella aquimaris]|uniref:Lipocalin-like domain-containing protein n=1 Tax=Neolewinella aquimaris TaxID=1835722 RepID=A0A840E8W1_9BACT|nr:hypothetical protein [Neolewinella aquimaris]MBB4078498.1 hypothetical protein [Neolewinella aquimaris]